MRPAFLRLLVTVAGLGGCAALPAQAGQTAGAPPPAAWPAWQQFADAFVRDDGRVVDWSAEAHTVSEGQAYGMFFALVAGDRARFDRILVWTQDYLAKGDLRTSLPSWLWGQDDKGRWTVLDANSAADADLWLAYDLAEAGRLWRDDGYTQSARAMLKQVAAAEVALADRRLVLLPGPDGFRGPDGVRLNPSYLPAFLLDYFAGFDPKGPWRRIQDDFLSLLPDLAPSGCLPDWFLLTADGPRKDVQSDGRGSYDAVRAYLWDGITAEGSHGQAQWHKALLPFVDFVRKAGRLPEHWYPDGRAPEGLAPAGVEAALLPFYSRSGGADLVQTAQQRLAQDTASGLVGKPARYYEQALALFGEGWMDRRYQFDSSGRLKVQWRD